MERKVATRLSRWKENPDKKPLVLFGARQTGKTTSVLDFGTERYPHVIHIDFYRQPQAKAAFSSSLEPQAILQALEAILRTDIAPDKTLLFLDEIQECDQAMTALKFFCTDMPELDVIAAGSLLGVHVTRNGSFPVGYVDMLTMHPMDFEEFCWATGERKSFDLVRNSYATLAPCPLHDHMIELYRAYLMVGGMPEAVLRHAEGNSLEHVRSIQRNITTAYIADMAKYAEATDASKIVACWESLPSQLAKETGSTKFAWKLVAAGAKADRYGNAVDWLDASGIVSKCTQVTDAVSPLKSFENATSFKLYMADTGLLASAYDALPQDLDGIDHRSARFRGGMAENYVMQQLVARDAKPHYWGMQSRGEVEFLLNLDGQVTPIEVKSKTHVRAASLNTFMAKYGCARAIRVSAKNFGKEGALSSVPLYAACLIAERHTGTAR